MEPGRGGSLQVGDSAHSLDSVFPRYTHLSPTVPVWCVTPHHAGCIHRFYDTSPFSPSGRYLALTQLPFEDRLPKPGDLARVVVVDLLSGEVSTVAETRGWDTQLGAQAQWGADDGVLLYNDVDTADWSPFGVALDWATGARRRLEGAVYMVSPDGRLAASPCLRRAARTQPGYGVVVPETHLPLNEGAPHDDGLYVTDTATGRRQLVASLADIAARAFPAKDAAEFSRGEVYGFHVKWNPQGDRLMFVIRQKVPEAKKVRSSIVTMRPDGSDMGLALHWREWRGHHPNWCPDGRTIIMNLKDARGTLRLATFGQDGDGRRFFPEAVKGSGHPTVHPYTGFVLTDAKPKEGMGRTSDGSPLRWIDPVSAAEKVVLEMRGGSRWPDVAALRVDLHPAWDRSHGFVAINGAPDGIRRVFVADLRPIVAQHILEKSA